MLSLRNKLKKEIQMLTSLRNKLNTSLLAAALLSGWVLATTPALAQPTAAKPITMKLAHSYPTVSQHHRNVEFFKAEIEKRSGGRLLVDIFPASQLMPITQEISGILSGQIHAAYSITNFAATVDPLWEVFEMPFLLDVTADDQSHLQRFIRSDRGGGALKASIEAKGLKVLSIGLTDVTGVITNNIRPIAKVEDFAGLKIRTAGEKRLGDSIRRLGASPIAMPWAELSAALVTGTVDGAMAAVVLAHDTRLPVKYLSIINLRYVMTPLLVSKRFFDGLPPDLQKALLEAGRAEEDNGFAATARQVSERLKLIPLDMKVKVEPLDPKEIARMKAATQPVLDAFVKDHPVAGKGLIEEARSLAK